MPNELHHAIDIAPFGDLSDPHAIVRLGVAAEAAGWDGLSIWDSLGVSLGSAAADPFVSLTAVAAATRRLALLTSVIALPRRRPQLVAQSVATLDRYSDGRCVLGIGAGGDAGDFEPFGESFDPPTRVARLDEGLTLVDRLLRAGSSDQERSRPPIWIGGMRPGALRRAAAWDGWIAIGTSDDGSSMTLDPATFGDLVGRLRNHLIANGRAGSGFDIAVFGFSDPADPGRARRYADQGATWWLESLSPMRGSVDELLGIVAAGPPS
jgi:alkanesulfonate monooxygenase SsuD/methylene tetrahydromethanopterin reductase-like flavin-dependent oxidoreductase (luciferase family)